MPASCGCRVTPPAVRRRLAGVPAARGRPAARRRPAASRLPGAPELLTAAALLAAALLAPAQPASAQSVPTPASVLGHEVGADFHLATFEESLDYFEALAAASDRVELIEVGRTSFGRPMVIAMVSSAENLRNPERPREIALEMAHAEGMTDARARDLAREGTAIVWIDGGLHATEVAHGQHTIQLAYDLVTGDDDPEIRAILDDVILLLWPSINPDGQTMVAEWYRSNLGTPFEVSSMPELYQKYVGHDNNRDGYMINMIESRVSTRVAREWEPQILYNHHQTSPFPTRIWIPPFAEPVSPRVHPLMWRTVNTIGMAMSSALEERGQKGATHMGTGFDNWYPGFMDHANNFHNVASFLTETALYRYATPHFYTVGDFPDGSDDLRPLSLYSSPWEGGWWRIGDAVDYMLTASISVLDYAAKYKDDLLYNRYQAGRDIVAEQEEGPPYAYFVPTDQRDPVAAVEMLRRLAFNGIEVRELTQAVEVDGVEHPAGTWVVPMNQPFAYFARQLFEIQSYPDLRQYPEGPPDQPYDVAGWTLPLQMGVKVIEAHSPRGAEATAAMAPLEAEPLPWDAEGDAALFDSPPGVGFDSHPVARAIVPPEGSVEGGGALHLDATQNNAFKALNRAWDQGATVRFVAGDAWRAEEGGGEGPGGGEGGSGGGGSAGSGGSAGGAGSAGGGMAGPAEGRAGTPGRWVISGLGGDARRQMVRDFALQASGGGSDGVVVSRPRVGLYRPWSTSMDEGWTRWLLEMYDFDFTSLRNADILAGELGERYDVIVFADMGGRTILNGSSEGSVPPRYVGGIGEPGVRELDAFVRQGGTVVTINGSSDFAMEHFHLPVRNVVDGLGRTDFSLSGSILDLHVDPSHPVMTGMPERADVMVGGSPVFTTEEGFEGRVLAKYPAERNPLVSGYLLGEEHLRGYAAALDVKHGDGRFVLLGMRPQWRGQPFGSFRILFNAVLYSQPVAGAADPTSDFWSAPPEEEEGGEGSGGGRRP